MKLLENCNTWPSGRAGTQTLVCLTPEPRTSLRLRPRKEREREGTGWAAGWPGIQEDTLGRKSGGLLSLDVWSLADATPASRCRCDSHIPPFSDGKSSSERHSRAR